MFHIEGRRWFQSLYGNTYHSVRVFKDGELIIYIPHEYGYGEQFIETALQEMEERKFIEPRNVRQHGGKEGGRLFLRETLNSSYSVIDVQRKRDL